MARRSWFKEPETIAVYRDIKQHVLAQPGLAVDVKKMMQLNAGTSITSKAMGFYDVLGMEVPDLYMMDTPDRLRALTKFRQDAVTLRSQYEANIGAYNERLRQEAAASTPGPGPVSPNSNQPTA